MGNCCNLRVKAYEKDAWQYDDSEEETQDVSETKPDKEFKEIDRNLSGSEDSSELGFFDIDEENDEDECNRTISWASSNDTSYFDDRDSKPKTLSLRLRHSLRKLKKAFMALKRQR